VKLIEVGLLSSNLEVQQQFYTETLGLPLIAGDAGSFAVQAGQTRLSFRATARQAGPYHLALDVPEHRFEEALNWVRSSVPLLTQDGQETFFFEDWDAHSLYFTDPCGNILELIARHTLPRPQHAGLLVNISEVGVAVSDVLDTVKHLRSALGVGRYGEGSASFSPAGTHEGLLILVQEGRLWFPTTHAALPLPLQILAQTPRSGTVTLPAGPIQITGVTGP
jgi:catechol 2,3-dioxygenase-like lactoylglutathione lyase family enzyme